MRAKVITIVSIIVVTVGLVALIQFTNSTTSPTQGATLDPVRGEANAPVTIYEYSDFQCPACKQMHTTLKQILQEFPGQVKLAYNDFPLRSIHNNAAAAAEAGQCALAQNAFWEYHDLLFQRQADWAEAADVDALFVLYGTELGLDATAFTTCLGDDTTLASITEDEAEGNQASVNSTPTLFVNDERLVSSSYEDLRAAVAKELGQ